MGYKATPQQLEPHLRRLDLRWSIKHAPNLFQTMQSSRQYSLHSLAAATDAWFDDGWQQAHTVKRQRKVEKTTVKKGKVVESQSGHTTTSKQQCFDNMHTWVCIDPGLCATVSGCVILYALICSLNKYNAAANESYAQGCCDIPRKTRQLLKRHEITCVNLNSMARSGRHVALLQGVAKTAPALPGPAPPSRFREGIPTDQH